MRKEAKNGITPNELKKLWGNTHCAEYVITETPEGTEFVASNGKFNEGDFYNLKTDVVTGKAKLFHERITDTYCVYAGCIGSEEDYSNGGALNFLFADPHTIGSFLKIRLEAKYDDDFNFVGVEVTRLGDGGGK